MRYYTMDWTNCCTKPKSDFGHLTWFYLEEAWASLSRYSFWSCLSQAGNVFALESLVIAYDKNQLWWLWLAWDPDRDDFTDQ